MLGARPHSVTTSFKHPLLDKDLIIWEVLELSFQDDYDVKLLYQIHKPKIVELHGIGSGKQQGRTGMQVFQLLSLLTQPFIANEDHRICFSFLSFRFLLSTAR